MFTSELVTRTILRHARRHRKDVSLPQYQASHKQWLKPKPEALAWRHVIADDMLRIAVARRRKNYSLAQVLIKQVRIYQPKAMPLA